MPNTSNRLTPEEREDLGAVIAKESAVRVARWIGCDRGSLASAVAGLPVRKGTLALIRQATFRREPASPSLPNGGDAA